MSHNETVPFFHSKVSRLFVCFATIVTGCVVQIIFFACLFLDLMISFSCLSFWWHVLMMFRNWFNCALMISWLRIDLSSLFPNTLIDCVSIQLISTLASILSNIVTCTYEPFRMWPVLSNSCSYCLSSHTLHAPCTYPLYVFYCSTWKCCCYCCFFREEVCFIVCIITNE